MQTAGVALLLSAYVYSERAWSDQTLGGSVVGLFALATPIVLTARAMRSSAFMPAVHMAAGLAFLAVFLDRTTSLSGDAIVWVLDLVLVGAIAVFVRVLLGDPDGQRHPWALNAFVLAMGGGFVLVALTVFETLHMSEDGLLALDAWLLLSAGVTLWGVHLAPPGLRGRKCSVRKRDPRGRGSSEAGRLSPCRRSRPWSPDRRPECRDLCRRARSSCRSRNCGRRWDC